MLGAHISVSQQRPIVDVEPASPYFVPGQIDPAQFASLRRSLCLNSCKWDPQVEDVSTLADFPLVLRAHHWKNLSRWAELLSYETFHAEEEIIARPQLLSALGMPRKLRSVLSDVRHLGASIAAVRVLRFDFHFTTEGWKLSEVNSDVPGGFSEASAYTRLVAEHFREWGPAGDPARMWAKTVARAAGFGAVALLSAPGFMEDHQVIAYLASCLKQEGCRSQLANPAQLQWRNGKANLQASWSHSSVDAVVRFFQAEWMPRMLRKTAWKEYFTGGLTPIANPGIAAISESKRLPLVWKHLCCPMTAWKALLPETRDPREADWRDDSTWILKTAYSNTGDTVCIREFMPAHEWKKLKRELWLRSGQWLAQKRFDTVAIETPIGRLYPCLGVYTVNGKTAGIYGRLGTRPWIDFSAIDVAILVKGETA